MPQTPDANDAPRVRSALVGSLDRALAVLAVLGVVLAAVECALLPIGADTLVLLVLPATFLVYLGAGLAAWRRRPSNPTGQLIILTGLAVYLASLGNTDIPALGAAAAICQTVPLAMMLHLLLAFPAGRITSRPARITVGCAYTVAILGQAPKYLFDRHGSFPPLAIADAPALAAAFALLQSLAGLAVVIAVTAILIARLRRAGPARRRVLIPLFCYGILAVLSVPFSSIVLVRAAGMNPMTAGLLQYLVVAGVPVAFVLGILRGGFARTGELAELGTWLGGAAPTRSSTGEALARALGDPSLRLAFRAADRNGYVDATGGAIRPSDGPGRGWVEIDLAGEPVGAIDYDCSLLTEPDLVRTAGRVVAIAVERERLTADLLASRRALVESRQRIVDAADKERRRIARDLHDGIQVQLVMLGLESQRLATAPAHTVPARATELRRSIDAAAADLRRLVHHLVPAALIERGLDAAADDLVDRMPIPTSLEREGAAADDGLGEVVENTAYFVIAEGLANVVKHAHARSARVCLRRNGSVLEVEVVDDGVGGARMETGSGLRGLADRVDAVGGLLAIASPPGGGTVLHVEVPCVS